MEKQETERMDKLVKDERMRLLRERVAEPTKFWQARPTTPDPEFVAGHQLKGAGLLFDNGTITLAGMECYRLATANRVTSWLKTNWFAVTVAVATVSAVVCGPFFDFLWGVVLP